jgi:hypothetical protein
MPGNPRTTSLRAFVLIPPSSPPAMPDNVPNAELMHSLGRLVRGLSALFWGLPLALILGVQTAKTDWLLPFGFVPPLVAGCLLLFALLQMSYFNRNERIWMAALDRAKLLATIMTGLSPFLYWWHQLPNLTFYAQVVMILAFFSLLFLLSVNLVLQRLTAMLPDEGLRQETRMFSSLNIYLVLIVIMLLGFFVLILNLRPPPSLPFPLMILLDHVSLWFLIFAILLPVAITMALVWKIKEVILTSIFGPAN